MMKSVFFGCMLAVTVCGCAGMQSAKEEAQPPVVVVKTDAAIKLDGKLSEAAWQKAPVHNLILFDKSASMPPKERDAVRKDKFENARVRLLYDDKYLYVGVELDDNDCLDFVNEDQYHCYRNADTFELFLSPVNAHHYWELYSTPKGNKTGFFFPAGGMLPMEEILKFSKIIKGLDVASQVQGTLNNSGSKDTGWSTEMRISRAELASKGVPFAPGQAWRVLLARYNYSGFHYQLQNSSYPLLPGASFHMRSYYSPVVFK